MSEKPVASTSGLAEGNEYDVVIVYSEVCVTVKARSWRHAENIVRRRLGALRPGAFSVGTIDGSEPAVVEVYTNGRDPHAFQPEEVRLSQYPYRGLVCRECGWDEMEHIRRFELDEIAV